LLKSNDSFTNISQENVKRCGDVKVKIIKKIIMSSVDVRYQNTQHERRLRLRHMTHDESVEDQKLQRICRENYVFMGKIAYEPKGIALLVSNEIFQGKQVPPEFPALKRTACLHCDALLWSHETSRTRLCCLNGKGTALKHFHAMSLLIIAK
jgi:hypothetical protein